MRRFLTLLGILPAICGLLTIGNANPAEGYSLGVTLTGNGSGSVADVTTGTISCTYPPQAGTCAASIPAGTPYVMLMASPISPSQFGGWTGSCASCSTTTACLVTMDGDKNCGAAFTTPPPLPPVMVQGPVPTYYSLLQDAFDDAPDWATIRSRDTAFPEELTVDRPDTLIFFQGGFDPAFSARTGNSVLNGNLIINYGTVIVDGLVLAASASPPPDTQPPTAPANLHAAAINSSQVDLTWDAATDNVRVSGYGIYRGGKIVGTTAATGYSDSALSASTPYCYTVIAYDNAGNISGQSAPSCATTPAAVPQGPVKVTLDATGTVQTTITAAGPGGSQLTLYAGTRVALVGADGAISPPASLANVYLSLLDDSGSTFSLPAGITSLAKLRIVLSIDGNEHDAMFFPTASGGSAQQGLRLMVVVPGQSVSNGTLGLLYQAVSGNAVQVGSSALKFFGGAASGSASASGSTSLAAGSGSGQMQYSPNSTGSYNAGGSAPGSGSAPGGAYWSSYNVADPGCIAVGNVNVCGPSRVDRIEISEESTAEILGMCWFGDSNTATTGPLSHGAQFWCERTQAPSGGNTTIKISSMQANLPIIHAYLVQTGGDKLPMWETYTRASGGLHAPDGAVYSDPYQKKEFKFAGHKELHFNTRVDKDFNWMKQHALQPILDKGYTAWYRNFISTKPGFTVEVLVDTLDARILLQEDVIEKIWKVRSSRDETKGNRGAYDYAAKYRGTAHATMVTPLNPPYPVLKVWEITVDNVTFTIDPDYSRDGEDVYSTSEGTLTQVSYTSPDPTGICTGDPPSFTDTYPIYKGDGYISIFSGSNPVQYNASASISLLTPVKAHSYTRCCDYRPWGGQLQCDSETLEIGGQQHMWLYMGGNKQSAQSDGALKGTYQDGDVSGFNATYEWDLKPAEDNQ